MKYFSLLLAFIVVCGASQAQPSRTLNYPNGKKFIEGSCSFTLNPYFHTTLLSDIYFTVSPGGRGHSEEGLEEHIEDADYLPRRTARQEQYINLSRLTILCDGPVTVFYQSGGKQIEFTFKAGALTGPTTTYYPGGGVAYRGAFEAGTPTGNHTSYYKNGSVFSKGRYLPFAQAELAEEWQYYTAGGIRDQREKTRRDNRAEDELQGSSDEVSATVRQRNAFRRFTDGLLQTGRKDGTFTFFRRDGKKWAETHFNKDVRTGTWTVWNETGTAVHTLEYGDNGRLVALTDSTGKRETLEILAARWRAGELAREGARAENYGDPNGIAPGLVQPAPPPPNATQTGTPGVITYVDQMPEFVGDVAAYLSKNLRYPAEAKDNGIEGRVVVRFVVLEDGSITDAKVARGIGGGCDEEALRVIRAMPKWKPGKQNGKAVPVWFNLPIHFKLG